MRHTNFKGIVYAAVVLSSTAIAQGQWNGYSASSSAAAPYAFTSYASQYPNTASQSVLAPRLDAGAPRYTPTESYNSASSHDAVPQQYADGGSGCSSCDDGSCGVASCGDGGCGGGYLGNFCDSCGLNSLSHLFGGLGCGCGPRFYAGVGGLYLKRYDEDQVWLTFDQNFQARGLMGSRDAEMDETGGYELYAGMNFCDCWAIEARYWSLNSDNQEANVIGAVGAIGAVFDLTNVLYDADPLNPPAAEPVDTWFGRATRHRLRRSYEFDNFELNLLNYQYSCGSCCGGCCEPKMRVSWLAGFRYFRFDDRFQFASTEDGNSLFIPGTATDLFYDIDIENQMAGIQIGGDAEYNVHSCVSVFAGGRMGVFNNNIQHCSAIYGTAGFATVNDPTGGNGGGPGPWDGQAWKGVTDDNTMAFLGEMNIGVRYSNCWWNVFAGYRAMALTGVALTTNQIPNDFRDLGDVRSIDNNGDLVLHGGFAGAEVTW